MFEPGEDDETMSEMDALRRRADSLERELDDVRRNARDRIVWAELTVEALKAGMHDLDGIKLLDMSEVGVSAEGHVADGAKLIANLKHAKPWLFGGISSSRSVGTPPAQPPRQKLATEMSDEEYRAARAAVLRRGS